MFGKGPCIGVIAEDIVGGMKPIANLRRLPSGTIGGGYMRVLTNT